MSRTFGVNSANDLYLDDMGNLAILVDLPENPQSIEQNCAHAAKTRLGEMIYRTDQGVAFLQTVFAGVPNLLQFESEVRRAIALVPGVINIIDFTMDVIQDPNYPTDNTRRILQYTAIIETIYGAGEVNG